MQRELKCALKAIGHSRRRLLVCGGLCLLLVLLLMIDGSFVRSREPPQWGGVAVSECRDHDHFDLHARFVNDPVANWRVQQYLGHIARITPRHSYSALSNLSVPRNAAGQRAVYQDPSQPFVIACNLSTSSICSEIDGGNLKVWQGVAVGQACSERSNSPEKTCFDETAYAKGFRCLVVNAADQHQRIGSNATASKALPEVIATVQDPNRRQAAFESFPFPVDFGDVTSPQGLLFVKTRPRIDSGFGVLLPLHRSRHFSGPLNDLAKSQDPPFLEKKKQLVWRGASTGGLTFCGTTWVCNSTAPSIYNVQGNDYCTLERPEHIWKTVTGHRGGLIKAGRSELLLRWAAHPKMNIGLSKTTGSMRRCEERLHGNAEIDFGFFLKEALTREEMLQSRYLLSVEGNDVATNTKWILASNSLLFMPSVTMESWLLEGALEPWKHYVPVRTDFKDLLEKVEWADAHPTECLRILANAHAFIDMFADEGRERWIESTLLSEFYRYARANPKLVPTGTWHPRIKGGLRIDRVLSSRRRLQE